MQLHIKPFKEGDEFICSKIVNLCFDAGLLRDFTKKCVDEHYAPEIYLAFANDYLTYVGYLDNINEPIIFGAIADNEITDLFLNPNYHNKGYGKEMLSYLEGEIIKYTNESEFFLNPESTSINFYKKQGYEYNGDGTFVKLLKKNNIKILTEEDL